MKNGLILAGLDIGACTIKCVVAEASAGDVVEILGTSAVESAGVRDGLVRDRAALSEAIRRGVDEAGLMAGCEIRDVWIAVDGLHMRGTPSHGLSRIGGRDDPRGKVTAEDIESALDLAQAVKVEPGHEVLHVIPGTYTVDGQGGFSHPEGMPGVRLEVDVHLIIGDGAVVGDLRESCALAGLNVLDHVYAPLAAAETLLDPRDRELGVVLIDIGGRTTSVTVFKDQGVLHSSIIPVGGEHVTSDVRDCLHIPTVEAERLKRESGCAMASLIDPQEMVEIPGAGGRRPRPGRRAMLCEIIEARVAEIMSIVASDLQMGGFVDGLPGGVVLTGGAVAMTGVVELTRDTLGMPAVLGMPRAMTGPAEILSDPLYATSCGLVQCGARQAPLRWLNPQPPEVAGWWSKMTQRFRK